MARIFVCGEALIDFVPVTGPGGDAYLPKPGGSPFNAAKAAAQAGADVAFLGAVSTDLFGDQLAADLAAYGVDTALMPRTSAPTTLAFVDFGIGDPRYAFFNNDSATAQMSPDPATVPVGAGDILDIGSISLIDQPGADNIASFALALADRAMLALDPNARPTMTHDRADWTARMNRLLAKTAILKISREDIAFLAPGMTADRFTKAQLDNGVSLVVVTDGGAGATAATSQAQVSMPAPQVTVEDTVGAGDTFMGNLLAFLLAHGAGRRDDLAALGSDDLTRMLRQAGMAAAINCTRKGCQPPTLAEVEAALSAA